MPSLADLLRQGLAHHQAGRPDLAEPLYRQVLQAEPRHADALHLLGVIAHETGHAPQAIALMGQAIAIEPSQASYHFNLGEVHRALGDPQRAASCYDRALRLNPRHARAHNNLGTIYQDAGDRSRAETCFRQALVHQPNYPIALNNLGAVLVHREEPIEARACFERALALAPDYPEAHNGLGTAWQQQERLDQARACYGTALRLRPDYASALYNLATVAHAEGLLAAAEAGLRRALALRADFVEALYKLGAVLKDGYRYAEAQAALEQALTRQPDHVAATLMLASVLELQGGTDAARSVLDRALERRPHEGELKVKRALLLPVIYDSWDHMTATRSRLIEELEALRAEDVRLAGPDRTSSGPCFFLAYQGQDDRDIQRAIAELHARAAPRLQFVAPHCNATADRPGPIRLGVVSRFFYSHTIAKLNAGWIRHLSRDEFHVTLFRFRGRDDAMARHLQDSADAVVTLPGKLEAARQRIAEERLDVLFYTDIGMDPLTYFLAFARLAPLQCATWGHPVTTGIPSIDVFVSSRHLDPPGAESHYTERLVRLDHLNTYYTEPRLPEPRRTRRDFGLDESWHLYLCAQSLYKMHVEFDPILAGILRADPLGRVVLIEGMHGDWKALLRDRFQRAFADVADRVLWLPQMPQDAFLGLQALADVLLDTTHFGGGNTSYEAFAFGTPIVTLPGPYLRSRITYACYRQMDLSDGIARDAQEYVEIAVRLGRDPAWRAEVRDRIRERKHRLYEDLAAVRQLEQFLKQAVQEVRAGEFR